METKTLALYGTAALVGLAAVSTAGIMLTKDKSGKNALSNTFVKMDRTLPDDFFKTILPEEKPVELLPPPDLSVPEKPVEPPPPPAPVVLPPAQEVFTFVEKAPEPEIDPVEVKRRAILAQALFKADIANEIDDHELRLRLKRKAEQFPDNQASTDKDFSAHGEKKEIPTFPVDLSRVLTANKFIPAVLVTAINSEIPSEKVIAQIETDVVAFHGNKILIPKGSQAIGSYQGVDSPDSLRMAIIWKRIITPDGINIKMTAESSDAQGVAGLTGYVDSRWKEKYGTALIFSSLSALAQLTVPVNNDGAKAAADSFSKELSPVVAEQLRRALDKINRISIPQGERINISPLTDLWFKDPKDNQVAVIPLTEGTAISNGK